MQSSSGFVNGHKAFIVDLGIVCIGENNQIVVLLLSSSSPKWNFSTLPTYIVFCTHTATLCIAIAAKGNPPWNRKYEAS